jgi:hypothetical protein
VPAIEVIVSAVGDLRRLPREGTTLVRPNLGAELVCRLTDMTDSRRAIAWLSRGSDQRQAVLGHEVRFASLLPGRWLLEVELDGKIVERREFNLRSGELHSYVVHLPSVELEEVGS